MLGVAADREVRDVFGGVLNLALQGFKGIHHALLCSDDEPAYRVTFTGTFYGDYMECAVQINSAGCSGISAAS
ncbi:hypothetical protein GCM10017781_14040 [Deinococcus metalli]|uniref:Uncharacterized protein n=1 Tax=Deinococcus metalli TaxID=1141878 RepID=A0ABQ3JQE5_9DEIO|nr:hypothetical protein GCM10017781_14040 [Deinococcus metalli]